MDVLVIGITNAIVGENLTVVIVIQEDIVQDMGYAMRPTHIANIVFFDWSCGLFRKKVQVYRPYLCCMAYGVRRECDTCYRRVCDTCRECVSYGCVEYGRRWDSCKTKERYEVCEDKYRERCKSYTKCDERKVCDAKPMIIIDDIKYLKPNQCFTIKLSNLETPIRAKLSVSLGSLGIFDGVVTSNEKKICLNDFVSFGDYNLNIKVWDLSDDPNYDFAQVSKRITVYSEPVIYDVNICYKNSCGIYFEVPKSGFTLRFKTKYADSVLIELGDYKKDMSASEEISVELRGKGILKIIAYNRYSQKEFVYGEIKIMKIENTSKISETTFENIPVVPEKGEGENKEGWLYFATLTAGAVSFGLYFSRRLEDYIRKMILSFVSVNKDFWNEKLVEIEGGIIRLTKNALRYIERIKKRFSLFEIKEKLKEIAGRNWKRVLELFNSFKTKIFNGFYEFKYKEFYKLYGKEFVDKIIKKYGERAVKVLGIGLIDKDYIEFVLENNLERFGEDLRYLEGIYRIVPKEYFEEAMKVIKATGRRDFLRFLINTEIIKEFKDLSDSEILKALEVYSLGEEKFLKVYNRFGIEGIRKGLIDKRTSYFTRTGIKLISRETKLLEDWDKTVYLYENFEIGERYTIYEMKDISLTEDREFSGDSEFIEAVPIENITQDEILFMNPQMTYVPVFKIKSLRLIELEKRIREIKDELWKYDPEGMFYREVLGKIPIVRIFGSAMYSVHRMNIENNPIWMLSGGAPVIGHSIFLSELSWRIRVGKDMEKIEDLYNKLDYLRYLYDRTYYKEHPEEVEWNRIQWYSDVSSFVICGAAALSNIFTTPGSPVSVYLDYACLTSLGISSGIRIYRLSETENPYVIEEEAPTLIEDFLGMAGGIGKAEVDTGIMVARGKIGEGDLMLLYEETDDWIVVYRLTRKDEVTKLYTKYLENARGKIPYSLKVIYNELGEEYIDFLIEMKKGEEPMLKEFITPIYKDRDGQAKILAEIKVAKEIKDKGIDTIEDIRRRVEIKSYGEIEIDIVGKKAFYEVKTRDTKNIDSRVRNIVKNIGEKEKKILEIKEKEGKKFILVVDREVYEYLIEHPEYLEKLKRYGVDGIMVGDI